VKALAAFVAHSLYRKRWLLLAELIGLFVFQVLFVAGARTIDDAGGLAAISLLLPQFMQEWAGVMMSSFRGLALLGYSHPIVVFLLVATAIVIATEIVEETESRFVDLVMARPLPRSTPVNRSIIVLVLVVAAAVATMMLGTWIGLKLLAPQNAALPSWRLVGSLAAGLAMAVLAWGGIALAIASVSTRRANAAGTAGLLAVGMFVLALLGEFWAAAAPYAQVSPFSYHESTELIAGGALRWADVGVLAGIAVTGWIVAHMAYARRDL
jgi:ABC-type transport system involved in multi-copper enzyme maturation permease subunit